MSAITQKGMVSVKSDRKLIALAESVHKYVVIFKGKCIEIFK